MAVDQFCCFLEMSLSRTNGAVAKSGAGWLSFRRYATCLTVAIIINQGAILTLIKLSLLCIFLVKLVYLACSRPLLFVDRCLTLHQAAPEWQGLQTSNQTHKIAVLAACHLSGSLVLCQLPCLIQTVIIYVLIYTNLYKYTYIVYVYIVTDAASSLSLLTSRSNVGSLVRGRQQAMQRFNPGPEVRGMAALVGKEEGNPQGVQRL